MAALSNHVPDPRLITATAEHQDGPLHRVNPWTKVGIVGALVLAVTVIDELAVLAGLYTLVLLVYAWAGLSLRRLAGWYTIPLLFVVSLGGPLLFLEPGAPIGGVLPTPLGSLSITIAGVELFLELAARSLTVVTFVLAAAMTTQYTAVVTVIGRLFPRPIDQIALLTYRFTFVMIEILETLVKGARARGASLSEFWSNRRLYARIMGVTLLSAIDRSERLVKSMEARGYDGNLGVYGAVSRPPAREWIVIGGVYAAVGAYWLFRRGVIGV